MSDNKKSSDSRKWDKLDTLVFLAGGRPHEKARSHVQDKAWEKKFGKDGKSDSKSHWSTDSTQGSSSSKDPDTKKDSAKKK